MQRRIDIAIEEIPHEKNRWSKSTAKSRRGRAAGEETQHVANEINSVILYWVPTSDFKGNLSFSSCANVFTGIVVIFVG